MYFDTFQIFVKCPLFKKKNISNSACCMYTQQCTKHQPITNKEKCTNESMNLQVLQIQKETSTKMYTPF